MAAAGARVDSWLWAVRVFKTRSAATTGCRAGHVKVNGERAKAALVVKPGDEVRVRIAGFDRVLVVVEPIVKRVSAAVAATAFVDNSPPLPTPEEVGFAPMRDRGAGRPTKRERREIDRLRGRDQDSD
ncbi:RNA-binding S4 domain-containing protein [Schumannella luteola]